MYFKTNIYVLFFMFVPSSLHQIYFQYTNANILSEDRSSNLEEAIYHNDSKLMAIQAQKQWSGL